MKGVVKDPVMDVVVSSFVGYVDVSCINVISLFSLFL